jgi:pimeloyl-ACP methyl ester carboxylesterase
MPPLAAIILTAAGILAASLSGARAEESVRKNTPEKPPAAEPLVMAKQGWFFVGGKINPLIPGWPTVGHMYVEYQIPQKIAHPYPVVMIHGGWQTGTNFTGTPDGRDGWAQYFLRRGYAVYVVDQVARGRAAQWSVANGPVTEASIAELEWRFVKPEVFNLWPQAHLHTRWPGSGAPDDPIFDQFYASQFPSLVDFSLQQALNRDAAVALIDRIGPAVLLVHSRSGAFAWPIADRRRSLVKAIVALEPSGPPAHDVDFNGAPEWFADNPHLKPYGLVDVPLTYDPPVDDASPLTFVREDTPERSDCVRCWMQAAPARKLVNLLNIPILIVTAEASHHASYDHCTVRYLAQAGVKSTFVRLEDVGIRGNGHMMMLENNSDVIAGMTVDWLDRTTAASRLSACCSEKSTSEGNWLA